MGSCASGCSSLWPRAVLGELPVAAQGQTPLPWRGKSPASCSLDPADKVQAALRGVGMIGIPQDCKLDISGNSAKVISAEESMLCLNCLVDVVCVLQMNKILFANTLCGHASQLCVQSCAGVTTGALNLIF